MEFLPRFAEVVLPIISVSNAEDEASFDGYPSNEEVLLSYTTGIMKTRVLQEYPEPIKTLLLDDGSRIELRLLSSTLHCGGEYVHQNVE